MYFLIPISAWANVEFNNSHLIGKWQCQTKSDGEINPDMLWQLEFLANGVVNETIKREQGQKGDYAYQTERLMAKANWTLADNQIHYRNYQILSYLVRMPNADKYDIVQADLALQQSLPIIEQMVGNLNSEKAFDIDVINKKSIIIHDSQSQKFWYCHKRNWLNALFD